MFKVKTDYYQICKIVQRFKDEYVGIKLLAGNHELKAPTQKRFQKYSDYYGGHVADTAYKIVCDYVSKLNSERV